ncbi:DUF418 domain-containing protein [Brevibacterium litoralis]|uniref:DUF418 domain-containing protein n=1 Tax=Brevibacterium litoralis TaxID=3138935 RepID=UPI0032ED384A
MTDPSHSPDRDAAQSRFAPPGERPVPAPGPAHTTGSTYSTGPAEAPPPPSAPPTTPGTVPEGYVAVPVDAAGQYAAAPQHPAAPQYPTTQPYPAGASAAVVPRDPTVRRGPVTVRERAVAPDLARGFALLFIALANTPFWFFGDAAPDPLSGSLHPAGSGLWDQVVNAFVMIAIDQRTYPLFALLFGYGMMLAHRRQVEAGTHPDTARNLLIRRNLWLLAFGGVHALLLFSGDILGAYGLTGIIVAAAFLKVRDRTLGIWFWSLLGLQVVFGGLMVGLVFLMGSFVSDQDLAAQTGDPTAGMIDPTLLDEAAQSNYFLAMLLRLGNWVLATPMTVLMLTVPTMFLAGIWAARKHLLEQPFTRTRLLVWTAVLGLLVGWGSAVPGALVHLGVLDMPLLSQSGLLTVSTVTGMAAGLGYAALFGLLGGAVQASRARRAVRRAERGAPVPDHEPWGLPRVLGAVGSRSLTCYLLQSVVFAPALAAWGFGLGDDLGPATMAAFALSVWAFTVLVACVLEACGVRGPAESLLRRLTYRRAARA